MKIWGWALVLALGATGTASAAGFGVEELRGGVMAHSIDQPGPNGSPPDFSRIEDLNVELVFTPIAADELFGSLRPNFGATVNFGGLESMAYAGLTWHLPVLSTPLFVEAGFGAAIHDGALRGAVAPARDLGCSVLFHEQLSVGYELGASASVMLTAEHASSADLCLPNRGLTNVGVRLGWKF
jgi:hypothetical protein